MEIVLAVLYVASYIIKRDGNYDLFYVLAALIALGWVAKKNNRCISHVSRDMIPFWILGIIMFFYPNMNWLKFVVYESKLLLCMILMEFVIHDFEKIKWERFIKIICLLYAVGIVIALFWSSSFLWRLNDTINVYTTKRLKLLYTEPSELSFHCAILLIYYVNKFFVNKLKLSDWSCVAVLVICMVMSAGLGGFLALGASVICMGVYKGFRKLISDGGVLKLKKKTLLVLFLIAAGIVVVLNGKFSIISRFSSVKQGNDSSFNSRFGGTFSSLKVLLENTHWLGCGFGNSSTSYGMSLAGRKHVFVNSCTTFIAEAGIFAIFIIIIFCWCMLRRCMKAKNVLATGLLAFILIYQIPGGYFTNPMNYMIYGIVMALTKKHRFAQRSNGCFDNQ
jgi:hypothetical protein